MAAPTVVTFTPNTYAGSALAGYMAKSLLAPKLIQDGLVTVLQNVKTRKVLLGIDDEIEFQTPSAKFVGQTTPDIIRDETYLDPVKYEIMKEYSWASLVQSWEADQLKPGSMNDYDGTVDITNFVMDRIAEKIAILNEKLYILGKASDSRITFSGAYPGLLPAVKADAGVFKIDATIGQLTATGISIAANGIVTVASTATLLSGDIVTIVGANNAVLVGGVTINGQSFTIQVIDGTTFSIGKTTTGTAATTARVQFINKSNVIAVLSSIENTILDELRDQPDLLMYVPKHVERAYKFAQADVANGAGSFYVGDKKMDFLGRVLTPMPYWHANTIMVARKSNIFLGVDLLGDSELETVDMRRTTLDQVIRVKASMKSAMAYKYASEILLYRPN